MTTNNNDLRCLPPEPTPLIARSASVSMSAVEDFVWMKSRPDELRYQTTEVSQ